MNSDTFVLHANGKYKAELVSAEFTAEDGYANEMTGSEAFSTIMTAVRQMIIAVGEDPDDEGLEQTPFRVAKAWLTELFAGYTEDPEDYLTMFDGVGYDQMVIVKDISFSSTCMHHILPFIGKVHVGYIPQKRVVGLSKIPRLVHTFSRRLQIQEQMTAQIADAIEHYLEPLGVIVVVEAEHLCMAVRGVQAHGTTTTTSAVRGVFVDNTKNSKEEFLRLIGK